MASTNILDRYRDLEVLGSGGMGTVTLAEDTMLGRRVALKRLHTGGDPRGVSRLRREALVGASLSHPNLVSVYDVLTGEDGDLVVVMEYVPGETLRDAIRRRSGLPVAQAMRVLDGVATGLDAIHTRGIVHRDVKPANILLGTDGAIKLADLGVASVDDRTKITTDGAVLGTFSYMAPEQLEGRAPDPAMDIYALSAVAYEVLSGRKARPEPNPLALAHAISTQPPPDLREAWQQAPAAASEVLRRGMARDPVARPRSAGELMARLRESFEPETTAPERPRRPARPPAPGAVPVPDASAPAPETSPPAPAAPAPAHTPPPVAERDRSAPAIAPAHPPEARAAAEAAPAAPADAPPSRSASGTAAGRADDESVAATAAGAAAARRRAPAGRRRGLVLAGLLVLAAAAVVAAAVVASSGGSKHAAVASRTSQRPPSSARPKAASASSSSSSSASSSASATAPSTPTSPPGSIPARSTPVGAVEAFYGLATQHRFAQAWQLADAQARGQLAGYQSFVNQQSATRSITFHSARVVSQQGNTATVALQTTSVRNDGSHECQGSVSLVNAGGVWQVDRFQGISCTPP